MLNKNNLRIGNYVTNDFNEIILVKSINDFGINLQVENNGYDEYFIEPEYRFDEIKPIQITEDLLIKIQSIKDIEYNKSNQDVFPSYNIFGLLFNFINDKWIEYVSRIEVAGLHHLQNIFYFRTNKELEINL